MSRSLSPRHCDNLLAAALFAIALAVYLRTLCPTIYWGDCGELAAAAYTLGIAHPTGYPVWCLLGKLWTLILPFGSIIWRLNTMSAFFGALAVAALYGFARNISLPRPLALAVAGLFAFSPTFWQQCLFAETYSLTACYTCTLLFLAARWRVRGCQDGDLRLLAAAYGLAMTNHQTNSLYIPGFVAFVLWSQPALLRLGDNAVRKRWLTTVGLGLLPLLFYAYLPLRAMTKPASNWGNPVTPFAFFYHVTGRCYAYAMFHSSAKVVLDNLGTWAKNLGGEFPWPLIAFSVLGLLLLWQKSQNRPLALLLAWVLIADVGYAINYYIYNRYIYFIPSYIVLSVSAGEALAYLWQRLQAVIALPKRRAYAALAAGCALALVPIQAAGHWHGNDLSQNWTCYDYGRNLLATVPPGGILVDNAKDTSLSAVQYLQRVEGYRSDVIDIKRSMLHSIYNPDYNRWVNVWYLEGLIRSGLKVASLYPHGKVTRLQAVQEDVLRRVIADAIHTGRPVLVLDITAGPIFMDENAQEVFLDKYLNTRYSTAQVGLLTRLCPRGKRPSAAALLAETRRVWQSYSLRGVYEGMYMGDDYLTPIALDYADAGLARARLAYAQGAYDEAEASYQNVLKLFKCAEATEGVLRCAQARRQHPAPRTSQAEAMPSREMARTKT